MSESPSPFHFRGNAICLYSPSVQILCLLRKVKVKSLSRVRFFATPWTVTYLASPSMEFSRQKYWSGLPFPSPRDLPDPGIEPGSSALEADDNLWATRLKVWFNSQLSPKRSTIYRSHFLWFLSLLGHLFECLNLLNENETNILIYCVLLRFDFWIEK